MPAEIDHPFAQYIRILGRGKKGSRALSFDEARSAMAMIVADEVDPMQLGAFLMLLRVKEESPEELAGFVSAIRAAIAAPATELNVDLDWSSYAGKRQQHPWYLLAALTLADSGLRVLMHGARGHTPGRLYSQQALAQLGLSGCDDWQTATDALNTENFAFIDIAQFCPPIDRLLGLKPVLGLRSAANSVARLLNPANAPNSLHSIFHPRYAEIHQQTLKILGQDNAAVFKGEGGEIERKPDATCEVLALRGGEPETRPWPRLLAGRQQKVDQPDARALVDTWRGNSPDAYGEAAIIGTLSLALDLIEGPISATEGQHRAQVLWASRNRSRL